MVEIKKIIPQTVEHFDSDGNSLGFLNENENLDLLCQIAEQKVSDYYLIFEDKKVKITSKGELEKWPSGLYDIEQHLFARLFNARKDAN